LADLTTYLPCDILHKVDIASMAHSLECRQPFLDYRVVEWAAGLPIEHKFRRGRGKQILQRTFASLLPADVWRRAKMGFGVPLDHWFRNELRDMTHDVLLDRTSRERGFFCPETVARLLEEHEQHRFDHAYRLWALLVFELWMRQWSTASPSPTIRCSR
jgi:asparagine synthase (glutamine-hydrolysing)